MWVLGGTNEAGALTDATIFNDTWYSTDGKFWTNAGNAEWVATQYHAAEVYDGKMWVMGGGRYVGGAVVDTN
jgi:hypothetical protein